MLRPESDLGVLLKTMGEYQDQHHAVTGDHASPTMVRNDWAFHEQRTGFSRETICRLLPQLVAEGLAEELGKGKGMPFGYRASDGYAWISAQGQRQRADWEHPAQLEITGFGRSAQMHLQALITQAAALGVTTGDIDRLEALLRDIADTPETGRTETAANLAQLLQGNEELSIFVVAYVLPFLRSVVAR